MPTFSVYLGIDYSGAETADSSLKGLRVYRGEAAHDPIEQAPPVSAKKYWTRRGLAEWLAKLLENAPRTLVCIDHGFSFPQAYFERHGLPPDWVAFLEDFRTYWPTDKPHTYVDFARYGRNPTGLMRTGEPKWRRKTELAAGNAKSVFHFDVQGSVAKSTHAGLPWLLFLRRRLGEKVHFWPFDGWEPDPAKHVIAEVYPRLWSSQFPSQDRTPDQHDAYSVAAWMRAADAGDQLPGLFQLDLPDEVRAVANFEGWILGVSGADGKKASKKKAQNSKSTSGKSSDGSVSGATTVAGYVNRNNQVVIRKTVVPGNDHGQKIFVLHCAECDAVYGANGSDIHQRKCPVCQAGAPGLKFRPE